MSQVILSDENCDGHARAIFRMLAELDLLVLLELELKNFVEAGLPYGTDDETVWRFCQAHHYLLLTGNRTTKDGEMLLESTVRRLLTPTTLPVLTIGDMNRVLPDRDYRQKCAEQLAEIVLDLDNYRGASRLYL